MSDTTIISLPVAMQDYSSACTSGFFGKVIIRAFKEVSVRTSSKERIDTET